MIQNKKNRTMNNISDNIKGFVILIVMLSICFAFGFWFKSNEPTTPITSVSKSDTLYFLDTTRHSEIHNHFHITNVYTVTPKSLTKIDSISAFVNHYTKRFVSDTISDSLLILTINDTLFNNKIDWRKTSYKLVKPTTVITTTTTINSIPLQVSQVNFYAGSFFGFNHSQLQSAGIEANLATPKFNYGLGYDFKNNSVTAKFLVRIRKK